MWKGISGNGNLRGKGIERQESKAQSRNSKWTSVAEGGLKVT